MVMAKAFNWRFVRLNEAFEKFRPHRDGMGGRCLRRTAPYGTL